MATTVRLPHRLEQTLATYCAKTRRTKSAAIIEALEHRFAAPAGPEGAASTHELALEAGFIGCVDRRSARGSHKSRVKAAIRAKHRGK